MIIPFFGNYVMRYRYKLPKGGSIDSSLSMLSWARLPKYMPGNK